MTTVTYSSDFTTVTVGDFARVTFSNASIVASNATTLSLRLNVSGTINGTFDVTYGGSFQTLAGVPVGGTFTSLRVDFNGTTLLSLTDFSIPYGSGPPDFSNLQVFLGGADVLNGGALNDIINGFDGGDTISAGGGLDIINGNAGDDTISSGDGDDIVRGGKGNDVLNGGTGNDFLAGDRGSDTLTGGAGSDIFHTFSGAGLDRVTDFSRAEGDRVFVQGTAYTVTQVGSDVVIDLGGGDQMILVGVQQASLTGSWIVSI